jgi:hypothetical protein
MLCFGQITEGAHCCIFMANISTFILLTEPCGITYKGNPFPWKCFLSIHIVEGSSGYTNATQCYVMCTLPVLLTCDLCKILRRYYKIYLISVQFTNILLEFFTLQLAE